MCANVLKNTSETVISQQKLASQLPRGTKLSASGTHIEVKGARNFSARPVGITVDEMYEDVVLRGMRSDGLSTKFGVKNSKDIIAKLVSGLFRNDARHDVVMDHFNSKRQKSNCAKTIFSTLTCDELKMMRDELFPSRIDLHVKTSIADAFRNDELKLQNAIQVLQRIQQIFSDLDAQSEILSVHNFQTRGFFADTLIMMTGFISQLLMDASYYDQSEVLRATHNLQLDAQRAEEHAAEILLSVGSTMPTIPSNVSNKSHTVSMQPKQQVALPETSKDEREWTAVEFDDGQGPTKHWLVQTPKGTGGAIDAAKLVEMINNQEAVLVEDSQIQQVHFMAPTLDSEVERRDEQPVTSQSYLLNRSKQPVTTLEITLPGRPSDADDSDDGPTRKKAKMSTVT